MATMIDYSANLRFSPCMHQNVVIDITGGRRFIEGSPEDNIQIRALCLDCGQVLTDPDFCGVWRGETVDRLVGEENDNF